MNSNPSIQRQERYATRLTIPRALIMKKPPSKVWKTRVPSRYTGFFAAISFQSLERNKKKVMATAPRIPYYPHK